MSIRVFGQQSSEASRSIANSWVILSNFATLHFICFNSYPMRLIKEITEKNVLILKSEPRRMGPLILKFANNNTNVLILLIL